MTGRRLLVTMGDCESIATWSGIPFHLLSAGRRSGFLDAGVSLQPSALPYRLRRAAWNVVALLRSGRSGGHQYSRRFLKRLWQGESTSDGKGVEYLSHFPLLPPADVRAKVSFYIDATLKQNFHDYGLGRRIAPSIQADAIARERDQYARAERVVCMSRWAADCVVSEYGVPKARVFVVRAGANIDEETLARVNVDRTLDRAVLRLGFVGKDWERKGGPFLLEVAEEIEKRGQSVEVIAVGPSRAAVPGHRLVRSAGFVDKRHDLARFANILSSTHFGCLFSRAEALGISTLEFIRLGIPVVGVDVGGIRDCITPDVGLLFPAGTRPSTAAAGVLEAWRTDAYARLRAGAMAQAPEVTWRRAVSQLEHIWSTGG